MKAASQAVIDTLKNNMEITAQPRLMAEWEYNRYYAPAVTVNLEQTSDNDWYATYGNISSIVQPFRPVAGIAKARLDDGMVPAGDYRDRPNSTRYYLSDPSDAYVYWSSLQKSQTSANGSGAYDFVTPVQITVMYPSPIYVNKLVVGFELGYDTPKSTTIEVTSDGTNWTTVASGATPDFDGTITAYYDNTWGFNPVYTNFVEITGVRLNVYSMTRPGTHVDVLQISPRLENDLSDFLISYDSSFDVSSPSFIAPMGQASSNQATITLSNTDARFTNDNVNSLYYGLIDKKVRFAMDLGIRTAPGTYEYIREFTMWADSWQPQASGEIQVSCKDSSVILQEMELPDVFFENTSVGGVVWQILDLVGLTNYAYSPSTQDGVQLIPFYWPSDTSERTKPRWGRLKVSRTLIPTTTIWAEFAAIAESTQTALYFDEYDVLQIVPRKSMYGPGKEIDWNLDALQNGSKLPDVVDTSSDYTLAANTVEVDYRPCAYSDDQNGLPQMEVVWQPVAPPSTTIVPSQNTTGNTDVVLRASALVQNLLVDGTDMYIPATEVVFWEYDSDVNIEGEVLHYTGKEYMYYDANSVRQTAIVSSLTEQQSYDALNEDRSYANAYTGKLAVTARGLYGSTPANHYVAKTDYTALLTSWGNDTFQPSPVLTTQNNGYITQYSGTNDTRTYNLRKHGSSVAPLTPGGTVYYGTQIRFPSQPAATLTSNYKVGGLYFAGDWGDAGFFLDISSTSQIDVAEKRQWHHEVCLFGMPANASVYQLAGDNNDPKGFQFGILEDEWYQVDVSFSRPYDDGLVKIGVFINGVVAGTWTLPDVYTYKIPKDVWRFGTHVRGPGAAMDIRYLYAIAEDTSNPFRDPSDTSFLDLRSGGYVSGFAETEVKYNFGNINPSYHWPYGTFHFPQAISQSQMIFDEYGPIVHEITSFNVAFDTTHVPVSSSFIYLTNDNAVCLSYESDAYGAQFMLANAGRENVIVNGTETIQDESGSTTTVNHTLFIYGRCVYTASTDSIIYKTNDDAVRKQGKIRTQLTTRYIQTQEMADDIAGWILELFADGVDQVQATLFGNPLFQLGDKVTLNYPARGYFPSTHQYFITSIKNSFNNGYKTSVVLRRANV